MIGFGQIFYISNDEDFDEDFYNLDILTNQYNFITTLPDSDGGYGAGSSFDGLNNILYITNGFGNGGGGDDSTIVIGVDVSSGNFISQDTVPHTIRNFEVWDGMCYYLADDNVTGNDEDFYNLDIITNQYNFITTLPDSDGGYGAGSSFDGLNNILYITNGFGNGGGGDDSTIVIGVDVSSGNFISQDTVPHTIRNFEVQFSLPTSIKNTVYNKDREILMLLNILGQRTLEKKNTPLFYIYDDGTVEKKVVIE